MSATASGSSASQPNGSAKSRQHTDGSEDRKWTPEQKAEVIRVRKCSPTSFYEILAIEKSASDGQIKKAYRKISLLTHPDKNGYTGADEAFKMVSRAFQILSDADKKSRYDKFGGDPDSRFSSSSAAGASPFAGGFARSPGAGRGGFYEDEISPEELFNRFFGGGMGGMGGMGGFPFGGQGFVFNMGGGPGFRVHQMGGGMPRRRPPNSGQAAENPTGLAAFYQLLPVLLLFVLPLLTSFFSGAASSTPSMRFDAAVPPHTMHRVTPRYKVDYFINPKDVDGWTAKKFNSLDQRAEVDYVSNLQYQCELETSRKRQAINDATGFFYTDENMLRSAREMHMPGCDRLDQLRVRRQY